ncbi:MAG: zf-HC2 domain-containing protein, partial [Clostridia bacterium]|nr:zf-HC2 domain-containing protein [Clostridia bacterium]
MDRCEKIEKLLAAYADGELNESQKALVEQHVAHCPHCAALLDEYLALNDALASCTVKAPEGFAERVMEAVQHTKQAAPTARGVRLGRIAPFVGVGVAAVLCIGILGSGLVQRMGQIFDNQGNVEQEQQTAAGVPDPAPEDGIVGGVESAEMPTDGQAESMEAATNSERETYEDSYIKPETEAATNMESSTYPETAQDGIESEPTYEDDTPPTEDATAAPGETETEEESESESETET